MAKTTISVIKVNDADLNRALDAIAADGEYSGLKNDNVTPETKLEFAQRYFEKYLKKLVRKYEESKADQLAQQAFDTAKSAALAAAQNEIVT